MIFSITCVTHFPETVPEHKAGEAYHTVCGKYGHSVRITTD